MTATAQTSRPTLPSSFNKDELRRQESALRDANQRYRAAEADVRKAKTKSERDRAESAVRSASTSLRNAESAVERKQRDVDQETDRYNRALEAYEKDRARNKK